MVDIELVLSRLQHFVLLYSDFWIFIEWNEACLATDMHWTPTDAANSLASMPLLIKYPGVTFIIYFFLLCMYTLHANHSEQMIYRALSPSNIMHMNFNGTIH